MPFKPGKSGNPQGRPKGARNKTTVATEQLLDCEAEAITKKAIELAKSGDWQQSGFAWIASCRRERIGRCRS